MTREFFVGDGPTGTELVLRIDGTRPVSAAAVAAVQAVCDRAEDDGRPVIVPVHVTGAPDGDWGRHLDVALVTKWERVLRRLERLATTTVAVATGDVGGPALDVLLSTDVRIASPDVRLLVGVHGEATWPGMAVHRLAQQAGAARVRRAVLFGAPIDADEAMALRLVDKIAEDTAAELTVTAAWAGRFTGSELAIRRQLLFDATTTSFEDALGAHLAACDRALRRTAVATPESAEVAS